MVAKVSAPSLVERACANFESSSSGICLLETSSLPNILAIITWPSIAYGSNVKMVSSGNDSPTSETVYRGFPQFLTISNAISFML